MAMYHHRHQPPVAVRQPSLPCDLCDWVAETSGALQTHQASLHSQEMFRCEASPGCSQSFLTVRELRLHLTGSHQQETFDCGKLVKAGRVKLPQDLRLARCLQCRAVLYTEAARTSHGCEAGLSYECRACERYQLASSEKLNTHINLKHGSWGVKAVQGSVVLGPRVLPHLQSSSERRTEFRCAACHHSENYFVDIDAHIQTKHNISRDNKAVIHSCIKLPSRDLLVQQDCQICGSSFILQEEELLRHTVSCHGESKLPEFSNSKSISRTCRICLFNTNNSYRMEKHLSNEHRAETFFGKHSRRLSLENISSPQSAKSPSKLKVTSSPEKKSKGFKKKSKKSREKEGNISKEMEAESGKEKRGKKRRQKDPSESKKVVKKLAKMDMSVLLNLQEQLKSELENLEKEEKSSDCAIPEKKAVTLKQSVRFFGNK